MGIFIIQKQDEHIQKRPPWQEVVFRVAENFGRLSPQGGDLVQKSLGAMKFVDDEPTPFWNSLGYAVR